MKKLLLGLIVILSACSTTKYYESTYVEDYRDYNKTGFNVYPIDAPILTEYIPVSDISMFFYIGRKSEMSSNEGIKEVKDATGRTLYIPTPEYMLDKVVEKAKEMGANALIRYEIKKIQKGGSATGYEINAIAVKMNKRQ